MLLRQNGNIDVNGRPPIIHLFGCLGVPHLDAMVRVIAVDSSVHTEGKVVF